MTTPTTSSRTYARTNRTHAITACGLVSATRTCVHDGAVWETFSPQDLATYLTEGVAKLHQHLNRIANVQTPYTSEDEQQLFFMVESLVHARHAFEDTSTA